MAIAHYLPRPALPKVPEPGPRAVARGTSAELLPVPYCHVVFTLPALAAEIAFQNKRAVYAILFHAAAQALRDIAAEPANRSAWHWSASRPNPKHLGAEISAIAVLHTWGQTLQHHPHLHCIVPGGGLSSDGTRWVACRPGFFLPVRVLSRRFRELFLARLQAAFTAGELRFSGTLAALAEPDVFGRRREWSMPSAHSQVPIRCWPISAAIPIASRWPTRV